MKSRLFVIFVCVVCTGCPYSYKDFNKNRRGYVFTENLPQIIDPLNLGSEMIASQEKNDDREENADQEENAKKMRDNALDVALLGFYHQDYPDKYKFGGAASGIQDYQKQRRNAIQDALLRKSNEECEKFKDDLFLARSDFGFLSSLAVIGMSAAGAIVESGSQALSAATAATEGASSAFDQAYFQERAIVAVVAGIEAKRAEVYFDFIKRRDTGIEKYSVEAAVNDVFNYHGKCSIRSGLETTEETLADQLTELRGKINDELNPKKDASANGGSASPGEES